MMIKKPKPVCYKEPKLSQGLVQFGSKFYKSYTKMKELVHTMFPLKYNVYM